MITATTDILLPGAAQYYVRYDFDGALFRSEVADNALAFNDDGTEGESLASAYQGASHDNSVIFQLPDNVSYGKETVFSFDLSGSVVEDDLGTDADESDAKFADIGITRTGSIKATISVYANLTAAVDRTGALFQASGTIISISSAVGGMITSHADTADVSTDDLQGGPFRRFVATGMGKANSGVLATVVTHVSTGADDWVRGRRNAMTGFDVGPEIVSGLSVTVTSDPGNFAVATKNGGVIPTNRTPWMLAKEPECKSGALTLGVQGNTIETYKSRDCPPGSPATCTGDPDGEGKDGPLKGSDLTPKGIASANIARNTSVEDKPVGTNYFCVLVDDNTDPIPEIGDPDMPNSRTN